MDNDDARKLMCNAKVLEYLAKQLEENSSNKKESKRMSKRFFNRDWIAQQVHDYISATPGMKLDAKRQQELQGRLQSNKRSRKAVKENGSKSVVGYNLTSAEVLQILNFMPTEPVELHLMVEDIHERLPGETSVEQLLAVIAEYRKSNETAATENEGLPNVEMEDDTEVIEQEATTTKIKLEENGNS